MVTCTYKWWYTCIFAVRKWPSEMLHIDTVLHNHANYHNKTMHMTACVCMPARVCTRTHTNCIKQSTSWEANNTSMQEILHSLWNIKIYCSVHNMLRNIFHYSVYEEVIVWAISCRLSLDGISKIKTIGTSICTEHEKAKLN